MANLFFTPMYRRQFALAVSALLLTHCTKAAMPTPIPSTSRKLRILCLHGYHGNGRVLASQMSELAASIAPLAELVTLDAPSIAAGDFGWWHASDDGHYRGWERTREAIEAFFASHGPFDGVLGFSQGAALAGLLVGLRRPYGPLDFDFSILVSGFPARDPELARLYENHEAYALPSLHVIGRSDFVVAPETSRALAAQFQNPVIAEHAGGHAVANLAAVREFLEARIAPPEPNMHVVRPDGEGPHAALVVFRGGAYATSQGSGGGAAEWAAKNGMVGIEVAYSTEPYPKNYLDAAHAVRTVRRRAAEWGVDPKRVGVLGFSAGGHLASLLSTQPDLAGPGARPDFVILAYPLISFVDGYSPGAFVGSTENFFGRRDVSEAERRAFSNELHVTADHPPVFVWTTAEDALVPPSHAERFAEACRRAGVPVTSKVYPHGPHGLGLALGRGDEAGHWTEEALAWLNAGPAAPRR